MAKPVPQGIHEMDTTHRLFTSPIRRSDVKPSSYRTRDHPVELRTSALRSPDPVLLLADYSVSLLRSGVLAPHNGDTDSNIDDFWNKIGKSARNLP